MKVIELLNLSKDILVMLKYSGARLDDCTFISLYNEYADMRVSGEKVTYIVPLLAGRYGISERKVYDIIKRLGAECVQCD